MELGARSSGPSPWFCQELAGWPRKSLWPISSTTEFGVGVNAAEVSSCLNTAWSFISVLRICLVWNYGVNFLLRAAQLFHLLFCQLEKNQIQLNWNHYRMFILFYFLTLRKNTLMITLTIFHYSCKRSDCGKKYTKTQQRSMGNTDSLRLSRI